MYRKPRHVNPMASPLEPIFAPWDDDLVDGVREQFYLSPDDPFDVVLVGMMHRVWHRPRWVWPILWAAGRGGILVPEVGRNVRTMVRITATRDKRGLPRHTYSRSFHFPGRRRPSKFVTTIVYDPARHRIAELVGPANTVYMEWKTWVRPPSTYVSLTSSVALRVFGMRLWLPRPVWRWLFGVVLHDQRIDEQRADILHVRLIIWHPLVGRFFGYSGIFRLGRRYRRPKY